MLARPGLQANALCRSTGWRCSPECVSTPTRPSTRPRDADVLSVRDCRRNRCPLSGTASVRATAVCYNRSRPPLVQAGHCRPLTTAAQPVRGRDWCAERTSVCPGARL